MAGVSLAFNISVVPNHCWYRGYKYDCGVSLSCVFAGRKALDLCNGGMVWSCCVPRAAVDEIEVDGDGFEFSSEEADFTSPQQHEQDEYGYVNNASKAGIAAFF